MGKIAASELAKIAYLATQVINDRMLLMMPLWDGFNWRMWTEAPPGSIIEMQIVGPVHSNYVAKHRACETDLWIQFVDHMWQRANWRDVAHLIIGITDDFHLMATSVAKLRHYFEARETIDKSLISSFVKTELEYLITVARSVFDLLQEALSIIWNTKVTLLDPELEAIRKRHKLHETFTKVVMKDRTVPKTVEELTQQYALPPILAEQYVRFQPFYSTLLAARDKIIHGGRSVETIFVTEKGFCVDLTGKTFAGFEWKLEHHYNENNLVSLLPWVAHVVFGTIEACNDIMGAFASVFMMPPDVAPGYHIFIRDPANWAIIELGEVANGQRTWWSDPAPSGPQAAGSPVPVSTRATSADA